LKNKYWQDGLAIQEEKGKLYKRRKGRRESSVYFKEGLADFFLSLVYVGSRVWLCKRGND